MKKIALLFAFLPFGCLAQTYVTNVTVADVQKHKMIPRQTVVINGGKITQVGGLKKVPDGATTVDGTGKFLVPGLVDAHIHLFQSGGLYARPDAMDLREIRPYDKQIKITRDRTENVLRRYLRNGITTVIDPGATVNFLKMRDRFSGSGLTPSLRMSGPLITTYEPPEYKGLQDDAPFQLVLTPEAARQAVRSQLSHQPDFIKIWYIANVEKLTVEEGARKYLPTVQAAIDEAHKHQLKVAVHAMERITAQLAVENGCDYLVHSVEDEVMTDALVGLIKRKNVVLCPTLTVHKGYVDTFAQKLDISRHEIAQSDPFELGALLDLRHLKLTDSTLIGDYYKNANSEQRSARMQQERDICNRNLQKLLKAGVTIATGTDAGNIGTLHASSYLDELLAMQQAGMDNWQILEASTWGGAKVLGMEHETGSISSGKTADLLLLDANPIDAIENLTKINRVIRNGVVLDPAHILVETPEELVQRQLNAYNLHDIAAFLDTYDDAVEIYSFPEKLNAKGKQQIKEGYAKMFATMPKLHCELKNRIVLGNLVIDHERVRFADDDVVEAGAIYHVENGKISKVYFTP